jgi:hypothetical protein
LTVEYRGLRLWRAGKYAAGGAPSMLAPAVPGECQSRSRRKFTDIG